MKFLGRKKKFLALVLAVLFLFTACSGQVDQDKGVTENGREQTGEPQPSAGGEKAVTIAISNAWDSMMPLNTNSNYNRLIYDQIYDRLTVSNYDGTYAPRLADRWEQSEDYSAVTFYLNENALWHDGTPVTAEDVVFTFQMYSNPEVEALSRYYLQYIAGTDDSGAEISSGSIEVFAENDHQVTFNLKSPMYIDTLLTNLNNVFIVPKHIFDGKTAAEINAPDLWANPVGSGPFKYSSEINGERMELVKNDNFYLGAPEIDRLVIRIVDTNNMLAGMINGEIDIIGYGSISLDDWDMAKAQENLVSVSVPGASYQTLILNTQKPYLTEPVRQAISMAINREVLVNSLLQGEGEAIVTPIAPLSPYYNDAVEVVYDPDLARQILERENFPFDQTLTFYVPSGNVTRERASALVVQDLAAIGVNVQIEMVDFPTLMNNMRDSMHDLGVIGSGGTLDPSESRQMINPDSSTNFGLLTDYELSDLIDAGTAALNFEERKEFFDQYQVRMAEIVPMAYLYTENNLIAYNSRLENVAVEHFDVLHWDTWTWRVTE